MPYTEPPELPPRADAEVADLPGAKEANDNFIEAARILKRQAAWLKLISLCIGVVGLGGVGAAAYFGFESTDTAVASLKESEYNNQLLVFELVRTAAGAALLGAFAWGTLNLARAALDQATRYEKRLVAGHFLVYVLTKFETRIKKSQIELGSVMGVFKAWSDSVDSAFTHVKYGSNKNRPIAVTATKDGVTIATDGAEPPPAPRGSDAAKDTASD